MSQTETINNIRKVPEGYKQTAVGVIPEDWSVKTIGEVLKIENNKRKPISEEERKQMQGPYPYYGPTKIQDYINEFNYEGEYALIAEDGDHFLKYRDQPMTLLASGSFNVNNHAHVISGTGDCLTKWFYWFYNRKSLLSHITRQGAGRYKLNKATLERLYIGFPKKNEQNAIIQILDTWDEAIEKTQKLIDQLKQRNKGLAQQLLTGRKRLKGFRGEWRKYSYAELLRVVRRPVQWNDNERYLLISVRRRSGGVFYRESRLGKEIKVKTLFTAKAGDFLFSKMQIVHGASALVTKEFDNAKISGSYIATQSKDQSVLDIRFLDWYSKLARFHHQTFLASYGVHIEKMTFDFDLFLNEQINVPSVLEQMQIVSLLEAAEAERKTLEHRLAIMKRQKRGLMQKLLAGVVRVKMN